MNNIIMFSFNIDSAIQFNNKMQDYNSLSFSPLWYNDLSGGY